jgi:3-methyladenine DNA glycosylase AlkD
MTRVESKAAGLSADEVLAKLRKLGKPGAAEVYRRHGASGEVWGVSFADLGALTRKIKVDHALAQALWSSGVVDARTLALMVADPAALTPSAAEAWLHEANAPVLLQYLAQLVAKTVFARDRLDAWTKSEEDFARACGYTLLAALLATQQLSDADCRRHLAAIAKTIHTSPNTARGAMNSALIAIGVYRPSLREDAVAAARRIGKVQVDHGQTGCKTPDAEAYIRKAAARKGGPRGPDGRRGASRKSTGRKQKES